MMNARTKSSPRIRRSLSPKQWRPIDRERSRVLEDDAEISNDEDEDHEDEDYEDDDDDYYDDEYVKNLSKSPTSNTSSEILHNLASCRTRGTSKTPSIAKSPKKLVSTTKDNVTRPKQNFTNTTCFMCFVVCTILAAIAYFGAIHPVNSSSEESPQPDRIKIFINDIRDIKAKFPQQDPRSWIDIRAGVADVMNSSSKPWTFVLFSNESTRMSCLAELLGTASSKALQTKNSLILRPEDMGKEYGDTIDRLRPQIEEKKAVVLNDVAERHVHFYSRHSNKLTRDEGQTQFILQNVVHDLLKIDPGAIQAFHTMCDRENPLVKEAVYIITIIAPGDYSSTLQKPSVFVENLLINKFMNKVHEDKLQPLITRLTDGPIIPVVPGNVPNGCFS